MLDGQDHVDNHIEIEHISPDASSYQLFKGLLGGKSEGVFNGKILVHRDAQKTNAFQSSKNILLSEQAVINTKPQLEIYADDVKCSHGATVGQIDPAALFFLRSRGIPEKQALDLLYEGFVTEVVDQIQNESFKNFVKNRLGLGAS